MANLGTTNVTKKAKINAHQYEYFFKHLPITTKVKKSGQDGSTTLICKNEIMLCRKMANLWGKKLHALREHAHNESVIVD